MVHKLPKKRLVAVHDEDIENLLGGLDVLNEFKGGKLKCKFCNNVIDFGNLHSIFPQSGSIKFVCDSPTCVRHISSLLREGEVSL